MPLKGNCFKEKICLVFGWIDFLLSAVLPVLEDAHGLVRFVQHETTFAQMDKSAEKK